MTRVCGEKMVAHMRRVNALRWCNCGSPARALHLTDAGQSPHKVAQDAQHRKNRQQLRLRHDYYELARSLARCPLLCLVPDREPLPRQPDG